MTRTDKPTLEGVLLPEPTLLFVEVGGSSLYFEYYLHLCRSLRERQQMVVFVPVDSTRGTWSWYPWSVASVRYLDRWYSTFDELRRRTTAMGARWIDPPTRRRQPGTPRIPNWPPGGVRHVDELLPLLDDEPELARSVHSSLVCDVIRGVRASRITLRRKTATLIDTYWSAHAAVLEALDRCPEVSQVVVPNGRAPAQAAAVVAAGDRGDRRILLLEHGTDRGRSVFLATWRIHDRLAIQARCPSEPDEQLIERGRSELQRQRADRSLNPFIIHSEGESSAGQVGKAEQQPLAVVYMVSAEEHVGAGPSWPQPRWSSQWAALRDVVPVLQRCGFRVVIRHHPNSINKSWREFWAIHCDSVPEGVEVVRAFDRVSSYDLLAQAQLAVTWGSTLGLEAIATGVPVWLLGNTTYDQIADVRLWPAAADPTCQELRYTPVAWTAEQFFGFWQDLGLPVSSFADPRDADFATTCSNADGRRVAADRQIARVTMPIRFFICPGVLHAVVRKVAGTRSADRLLAASLILGRRWYRRLDRRS